MKSELKTKLKKLEKIFNEWIRLRDCKNGKGICSSCGKEFPIEKLDAGHFIGKQISQLRFDPRNVHVECLRCNRFDHNHLIGYTLFMQKKYGKKLVDEFLKIKLSHFPYKWNTIEIDKLIIKYTKKLYGKGRSYSFGEEDL